LVTVTYNSAAVLQRCWANADLKGARWVVVDNNSFDDSGGVARALGADVIAHGTNDGFSVANNAALANVVTPWVMFVNPDVVIADARDLE
ncbi:glycosyltransferase family 2 protein, partial [Escherichia coli]|uniref:glycosyltransferase family 2 protein n=1 Tax=Escherichia coli TaxID=562 RepID=UPI0015C4C773